MDIRFVHSSEGEQQKKKVCEMFQQSFVDEQPAHNARIIDCSARAERVEGGRG